MAMPRLLVWQVSVSGHGRIRTGKRMDAIGDEQECRIGRVAAVVAAAGFSSRMGQFKPLLPWRRGTVIEAVTEGLAAGGASPVLVVTGHRGDEIARNLADGLVEIVFNPDYSGGEMLRSYQVGVEALGKSGLPVLGALLALGDQPHIPVGVVRQIVDRARGEPGAIVIPSYMRRRGHPVYLPAWAFPELLALEAGQTLRDLMGEFHDATVYETVDSDCVRRDMDVPAEYEALRSEFEWLDSGASAA